MNNEIILWWGLNPTCFFTLGIDMGSNRLGETATWHPGLLTVTGAAPEASLHYGIIAENN